MTSRSIISPTLRAMHTFALVQLDYSTNTLTRRRRLCPHVDVCGMSTSERFSGTSSRQFPRRRGQRDVVVIVQTSTLEREVDVCVRSNFVTNGLPYAPSLLHCTPRVLAHARMRSAKYSKQNPYKYLTE